MADETPPTLNSVALAEASDDIPFEEFFANQNARDKGKPVAQATPPSAPEPTEPEPEPDDEKPREPPKPAAKAARHDPRARVQEAIAQRHDERRQREAVERERDELRTRIAALEQRVAPAAAPAAPQPSQPPPGLAGWQPPGPEEPEPRWEQYAQDPNPLAYLIAKTQYDTRQQIRAYAQQQQQQLMEQQARVAAGQVKQGLDAQWRRYATEHPDQPDVREQLDPEVGSLTYHGYKADGSLDQGTQLGNWIAVSGVAPDILVYLSQHKEEFRELVRLEPPANQPPTVESKANSALQAIYFGQMLERIKSSNGHGRAQAVSRAKPPIRRPAPSATPGASAEPRDDNDLSEAAVLRHFREGNAAEGRNPRFRRTSRW